ncbi:unnamed protein product, partial [Mesorhabditis belari]|uniref:CWH43-like N-terminal domain-containing protein n=1 Tax=Mesorhabditis belari TaxID=2138241 RepID=A0AAF3EYD3_9BILA
MSAPYSLEKTSSACSLENSENGSSRELVMTQEDVLAKNIKLRSMMLLGALLPGVGCYFCVAWAYVFQLDVVRNFTTIGCEQTHSWVPPVSYTIGYWMPQKYIWMFIVTFHFPARIIFIVLYRRLFLGNSPRHPSYGCILKCYLVTLWLEPIGLLSVSVLDITLFELHAFSYALWLIPFNFNMLFNVILHHFSRIRASNDTHEITWRIKLFLLLTGLTLSLSTAVSYPIFMNSCNVYAYYAFSIAEYLLVGYNSLFHFLAYWEFPELKISIGFTQLHTVERIKIVPQRIVEARQLKKNKNQQDNDRNNNDNEEKKIHEKF